MARVGRFPTVSETGSTIVEADTAPLDPDVGARFKLLVAGIDNSDNLVFVDQTEVNGPFATSWTPIGSETYNPVLATGTTLDGRIAIVTTDKSSFHVIYIAEAVDAANGRWAKPEDLGLPDGVDEFATLALARGVNGLDNVFAATTADNATSIWWKYRNPPKVVTKTIDVTPPGSTTPIQVQVEEREPPDQPWSDWINLNGALEGTLRGLSAANNADGRIVLTGIYTNAIPWVRQQKSDDPFQQESWGDWQVPGAPRTESAGTLRPILDSEGTVSVFASTNDGLLRSRQTSPGADTWSVWSAPGIINDNVQTLAVANDAKGGIYAAALNYPPKGEQALIYGAEEIHTAFAQWTSWQQVAMIRSANRLGLSASADGRLFLFAHDQAGTKLSVIEQVAMNSTEWTYFWTELAGNLLCFSVAQDLTV